ncbi:unnamed protein product [Arabidopsis lyrata]|uniref:Defensin-like protein n=1 Tax=Arabidopsis lyrata subsp. lyrata TaxID=81972 RepID=D7LXE7_ARALL|nr:defensin-like protein 301 [Arabidopsis lyrata subsp. lyrata]EFH47328.1 hypothetical protein ARALYDRAFT_908284 [Arabidopsis lyrata subsp. lyrata]CAH8269978.1 unnamed protein product [Arabidopsis lyrata]|eukprot:XP_002871069.1 defensin-like protein 301 [Arabidopsis lyrata subsp. lyrata]
MEKVTNIFFVLLLISSCLIMRSEGQFQCKTVADCGLRSCKHGEHPYCENHKCLCAHGVLLGGICDNLQDCDLSAHCPPNNHVSCDLNICTCHPN